MLNKIIRCKDCKYYKYSGGTCWCTNERNMYRGSGNEYGFDISFVGMETPFLTKAECDYWFCGDAEQKGAEE